MDSENAKKAQRAVELVEEVILGKDDEVREMMLAFLAGGNVLIEDIPGVGKTTLALAFSRALALDHRRVQFTPDVMPSDLVGFSVYRREEERFVYREGSVFCNLLLADEINRTSPKTQSALLEVMEEHRVTVEGVTRELPKPFIVIATENPAGSAGTQMLPESQLDRFMISLTLGYPDTASEIRLAREIGTEDRLTKVHAVMDRDDLIAMQKEVNEVRIKNEIYRYIVNLVSAAREHPYVERGASPRATIALVKMSRAAAWYAGRDYVVPQDVRGQFPFVVAHRLVLNQNARIDNIGIPWLISRIADQISMPVLGD